MEWKLKNPPNIIQKVRLKIKDNKSGKEYIAIEWSFLTIPLLTRDVTLIFEAEAP